MTDKSKGKIALLNGDRAFVRSITDTLTNADYTVVAPAANLTAFALLDQEKPDIIIIDLQPPNLASYALLDTIQSKGYKTPILLAITPELINDNISKKGIAGLLIKPIDHYRMLTHIKAILDVQKPTQKEDVSEIKEPEGAAKPETKEEKEKPLILIVDDEPDMQTLLADLLNFSGYNVATASDGVEGLNVAKNKMPSVILLDIMLPKLDGFQVCRLLKFNEKYRKIPIIMLTARSHPKDREIAEVSGADGYIVKPFETKQLMAELNRLIKK